MNRYDKEEKKWNKKNPDRLKKIKEQEPMSEEEWSELMNHYERSKYERLKESLTPFFRWLDRRSKELKGEDKKSKEK